MMGGWHAVYHTVERLNLGLTWDTLGTGIPTQETPPKLSVTLGQKY